MARLSFQTLIVGLGTFPPRYHRTQRATDVVIGTGLWVVWVTNDLIIYSPSYQSTEICSGFSRQAVKPIFTEDQIIVVGPIMFIQFLSPTIVLGEVLSFLAKNLKKKKS